MAVSSVGVALTSSTKTRLFSLAGTGITSPDSGSALKAAEVMNLSTSANNVEVYVAPLDGPELTDADTWPTNTDASRKGRLLEPGQIRQIINSAAGRGWITQIWARSAGATVTHAPLA